MWLTIVCLLVTLFAFSVVLAWWEAEKRDRRWRRDVQQALDLISNDKPKGGRHEAR